MGGAESLYVGLNHLGRFAWIGAFSSAPMLWPGVMSAPAAAEAGRGRGGPPPAIDASGFPKAFPTLDARANSQIRMLWIACGTADGLIGANRQFKDWLAIEKRAVHRAGSAGRRPRVAAVAAEPRRHGTPALPGEGQVEPSAQRAAALMFRMIRR